MPGDGLYGGQFIGAMYADAFFETDMTKSSRPAWPPSQPEPVPRVHPDVLAWHKENPNDWQATWTKINDKYQKNLDYRRFSCSTPRRRPTSSTSTPSSTGPMS